MKDARDSGKILGSPMERFTRMMFTNVIQRLVCLLSEGEFTMSQIAALHLVDQRQQMTVQEIAEALNLSASAASRMIDELVSKELLLRREGEKDRRSKRITCAAKGAKLLDDLSVERVKIMRKTAATLPATISKAMLSAMKLF